jgi:hypothetical protein
MRGLIWPSIYLQLILSSDVQRTMAGFLSASHDLFRLDLRESTESD